MTTEPVVEHAILMSGGGMQVRPDDDRTNDVYPLAEWICGKQRFGGRVFTRTIIVVEDWREVEQ